MGIAGAGVTGIKVGQGEKDIDVGSGEGGAEVNQEEEVVKYKQVPGFNRTAISSIITLGEPIE